MESEETEGRTLVQVISEKYSPENFPYCRGPGVGVVIRSSPQGSPVKDRLNLPRILVLDSCGITEAGDEEEVATFCAHVVELDLSHNQLKDWGEISKILSNIPNLDFLNLSMNPLRGSSLEPGAAEAFSGLRRLVLNNTHVTWDMVHTLTREILELEELFLCLNEYESVSVSSIPCPSLRLLHITDNQLQNWAEVRKLGLIYPGLVSLILANNSLSSIHEPEDSLLRLFPNLRSINLHNSGLCCWEDIEKLNFFPKLQEVRVMGIPLLQPYTDQERRYLMVAQLPHVTVLNGSVVSNGEREDAERFFIRYHLDCPEDELPQRYHTLVARYGRLAPLAEVDLRPLCHVQVEVRFGDQTEPLELRLDQTVADLKKHLRAMVQLPPKKIRVYYIDRQLGYPLEPQEMKYGARALHSYSIRDGDEILVVSKTQ
ncbi:tubulin-specific chaperone cofactor E-like protein isoform X2 [Sinocyclocheilus rhinocerous]|uniref:Tubulin-specific chaperone cofactor E-like protein n=1 Tax=Sinocyclocheilus rhinocerous TaxID=307959 RepID=A0A673MER3_9TELE|nr:PREDICTED: tubulin-specific chaperone cofactor E-like protein isoform X2 [Sinocyclocheilus rhinocerous]